MVSKSRDGTQAEGIALPVNVDKGLPTPLPDQLTQDLRRLISDGTLRPGDTVPSSRRLAKHLGISRGSVELLTQKNTPIGYSLPTDIHLFS